METDIKTRLLAELNALSDLEDNYDGYGAEAPTPEALERARLVLASTDVTDLAAFDAGANSDAEGGAGLWFHSESDHRSAWVVCRNDGQNFVVLVHNVADHHIGFHRFDPADAANVASVLVTVREFLRGVDDPLVTPHEHDGDAA